MIRQHSDVVTRLRFITKVTNMGDRKMVIFPKDREETEFLKGKYVRVLVEEIPEDKEEEENVSD
jgi:hypothetical protein